ncbi:MAG: DUF2182 domain-containing protein [Candidatus Lambdaproteobacteria bacterium]|nr:DUF2182 domain-containing protein [Candidatus Lambdaproteobacteria bacterium]
MRASDTGKPAQPPAAGVPPLATRDRLVVLAGLVGVAGIAWVYLLRDAARMQAMASADPAAAMAMKPWGAADLLLTFGMWAVMMVAMMLPSAVPAVLIYAAVVRRTAPRQPFVPSVGLFVMGYLAAWSGFSLAATGLTWALERLALLSPMLVATSPFLGGALLIVAGLYQWSPLKGACLSHCQAPFAFLAQHWRQGVGGAAPMGLHHGAYCIGCCWALMGLLFLGGVMNLLWVAALAVLILLEKLPAVGRREVRLTSGLAAVAAGVAVIVMAA